MLSDCPKFAAAIFDFDGTLVDTMPLHFEAYRQTLGELGFDLTEEQYYRNIGGNAREVIPKLLGGRTPPIAVTEIHARKKQIACEMLRTRELGILETSKLLHVFAGHLPMAIASSGARAQIEIVLARLDWQRFFGAVITGDDTPRGKPAPDLFLLAAEKLHVPPSGCIVFEDTDDGLTAARRAGMFSFDVRATTRRREAVAP